jgi:hypothetical protein
VRVSNTKGNAITALGAQRLIRVLRFPLCSGAGPRDLRCLGESRQPAFHFVLILDAGNG